jgi:transposase
MQEVQQLIWNSGVQWVKNMRRNYRLLEESGCWRIKSDPYAHAPYQRHGRRYFPHPADSAYISLVTGIPTSQISKESSKPVMDTLGFSFVRPIAQIDELASQWPWFSILPKSMRDRTWKELQAAYSRGFAGESFPGYQSMFKPLFFTECGYRDNHVLLSEIGEIPCEETSYLQGSIESVIVEKTSAQWKARVQVRDETLQRLRLDDLKLGLDRGLLDLVTLSDGSTYPGFDQTHAPSGILFDINKPTTREEREHVIAQIAERICSHSHTLVLESLDIEHMHKTKGKSTAQQQATALLKERINNSLWDVLEHRLRYYASIYDTQLLFVDAADTSRTCFACKSVAKDARKGKRFVCHHCGYENAADVNAAKNILAAGLR